jgi:parallel beta-helix repeat protein
VLHFTNAESCAGERCTFTNCGRYAVCLNGGGSNSVTGCDIAHSAEGGLLVIGSARNRIADNHIRDCGAIYKHIGGVVLTGAGSDENTVAHNLIHHMSRYGITIKNGGLRNVIEYNHVHHTNLETYDTGGIEVTQHDRDLRSESVIRNNIVADSVGWYAQGPDGSVFNAWGIYLDSYAGGYTVTHNITIRNTHGGIMLQGGKDNVVTNNIFAESSVSQIQINNFRGNSTGEVIERNVVYWTDPEAALVRGGHLEPETVSVDHNLYWCPGVDEPAMQARDFDTFADWRAAGYDAHSLIEDPLFVAPERDDYALQADSPAFDLGFEAIDVSEVGLLTER